MKEPLSTDIVAELLNDALAWGQATVEGAAETVVLLNRAASEITGLRKELDSWHEEYCGCKGGITDHLSYCLSLGLPHDCHHLLGTKP